MTWLPTFSVLLPLSDRRSIRNLETLLKRLQSQSYAHWELCIVHDSQLQACIEPVLADFGVAGSDRIQICSRDTWTEPARAANSALGLATGEFILLLPSGKTLADGALYEMARSLNTRWKTDIVVDPASGTGAYRRHLVLAANGFPPDSGATIDAELSKILQQHGARTYAAPTKIFTR